MIMIMELIAPNLLRAHRCITYLTTKQLKEEFDKILYIVYAEMSS